MDSSGSNEEAKWPGNLDKKQQQDINQNKTFSLTTDDLINCITTSEVISAITDEIFKRYGISPVRDLPLESWPAQAKQTMSTDNADNYHLEDSVMSDHASEFLTQSSDDWKIPNHPPCKRMCIDKESNKE